MENINASPLELGSLLQERATEIQLFQQEFWARNTFNITSNVWLKEMGPVLTGAKIAAISIREELKKSEVDSIDALCNQSEMLRFNFYATMLCLLISRYSQDSVVHFLGRYDGFNSVTNGDKTEDQFFLFRASVSRDATFKELFAENKQFLLDAIRYPMTQRAYENLMDGRLGWEGGPIFLSISDRAIPGNNRFKVLGSKHGSSLLFELILNSEVPYLHVHAPVGNYDREFLQLLASNFLRLFQVVPAGIYEKTAMLDWQSDREKALLASFNDTHQPLDESMTLIDHFRLQVRRSPESEAITYHDSVLSYRELDHLSDGVGSYLKQNYGIMPCEIVGVRIPRTEWLPILALSIFKIGAVYLPIDPDYPEERIRYIQEDSQCQLVIDELVRAKIELEVSGYSGGESFGGPGFRDLAYIIYTSGSTGKPKGAMIEHAGMLNHLFSKVRLLDLNCTSHIIQNASAGFDISIWQMFSALLCGGKITIYDFNLVNDPGRLLAAVAQDKPTILELVPSYLSALMDLFKEGCSPNSLNSIGHLVVTGEELKSGLVERWFSYFPDRKLVNAYGPTEASDDITHFVMDSSKGYKRIPIGKVVANLHLYVVDPTGQECPIGVTGEIFVSGVGVGRGYVNDAEKTKYSFIDDPFTKEKGIRMYRTGDRGRWMWDGNVEFYGRMDNQVKINGHRIEPGEIEAVICEHPKVRAAVVHARSTGDHGKELIGFIENSEGVVPDDLVDLLKSSLPTFMLPARFIPLQKFPLTENGKVDRRALASMPEQQVYFTPQPRYARDQVEIKLVKLWESVLGQKEISVSSNFFAIGGHSLDVIRLLGKVKKVFGVEISIGDLFSRPILEDQASFLRRQPKSKNVSILLAPALDTYPVSSSQRRLWLLSQLEGAGNIAYNMPEVYVIDGSFDRQVLEASFNMLIARHEILRTIFINLGGEARQVVLPIEQLPVHIHYYDLRDEDQLDRRVNSLIREAFLDPFSLSKGPLFRTSVIRTSEHQYLFTYVMHHIISDGWSMGIMIRELLELYGAFLEKREARLPTLTFQYKDYAFWQQSGLAEIRMKLQRDYWLNQMQGDLPVLEGLGDYQRPIVKTYNGKAAYGRLDATLRDEFYSLLSDEGVTLFMGLLSVMAVLISRYTGKSDLIIGSAIAGRDHTELEDQIGLYVNILALRMNISPKEHFVEILKKAKQVCLGAYSNQDYPFDSLLDDLDLISDTSRNPLFDISIILQNAAGMRQQFDSVPGGLNISEYTGEKEIAARFDLLFDFVETTAGIDLRLVYNSDIYSETTAKRYITHFFQLIAALVRNRFTPVGKLTYIGADELSCVLTKFSKFHKPYSRDSNIATEFRAQVASFPGRTALVFENRTYSYASLNKYSDSFATYLIRDCEIIPGDCIGLVMETPDLMIVAILAVIKAGAVYVPIDEQWPEARKEFVIADTSAKLLITSGKAVNGLAHSSCRSIVFDKVELPEVEMSVDRFPQILSSDLAYIMYTSGSTGTPKGVMVEHRGVLRLVKSCDYMELTEERRLLSTGSVSFDATTFEYWGMLLNGGMLVMCKKEVLWDAAALTKEIRRMQIDTMWCTSGWLYQLAENSLEVFSGLQTLITGGDVLAPLPIRKIQAVYPALQIMNAYGPTENTCFSTMYSIPSGVRDMYIGKPIANSSVLIVDNEGMLCPVGVGGELWVGGDGLSRGYLNNLGLTNERFILSPFSNGERMYQTGDLGRWSPDGNIEFLGRKDQQVKIRGYRIELAEVEIALMNHPLISNAVVAVSKNQEGQHELVGYIVSGRLLDLGTINSFLSELVPSYMLLSRYVPMQEMPLATNGKIDRTGLPDPEIAGLTDRLPFDVPSSTTEIKLAAIWEEVLGSGSIGKKDNFFAVGGHSLKLMQITSRIFKTFGVELQVRDLFLTPVLELQALLIDSDASRNFKRIERYPDQHAFPISAAQYRIWLVSRTSEGNHAYNTTSAYLVDGWIDHTLLDMAFRQLIDRHEILRTVFVTEDGGLPLQVVRPQGTIKFQIRYEDLRDQPDAEQKARVAVRDDASMCFDLSAGPLFIVALRRLTNNNWILNYVMHHIICDGWSMDILIRELLALYDSLVRGEQASLSILRIHYRDFTMWQKTEVMNDGGKVDRDYWTSQLGGELPVLAMVGDHARPTKKTFQGATVRRQLDAEVYNQLQLLSKKQNASVFMSLLALVDVLLYRYTGQEDLIVGSPIADRGHVDLEDQIGFYVNTIALRARFQGSDDFSSILDNVKQICLDGYRHQHYPFEEVVEALGISRDPSRNPIFDVWVVLQRENVSLNEDSGHRSFRILPYQEDDGLSRFDLLFSFVESRGGVSCNLNFNTDIFERSTIERMLLHLENLLRCILADPGMPVNELEYLDSFEIEKSIIQSSSEPDNLPIDETFISLIEFQAVTKASAIALIFGQNSLSYEELNRCANQLAHFIINRYDVSSNDIVAIRLPRSHWIVIAIIGILKSGAAYCPIELDYPEERVKFMIENCGCKLVFDQIVLDEFLQFRDSLDWDNPKLCAASTDLIYLIYTSGSTGRPKAVAITHRSLIDYCHGVLGKTNMRSCATFGMVSTFAADLGNTVLFPALMIGGTLHLFSESDAMNGEVIARAAVDCLKIVPAHWRALQSQSIHAVPTKCLVFGGEALTGDIIEMLREQNASCDIYNHYGPSEATIGKLIKKVELTSSELRVALGQPFGNNRAYILDDRLRIVPLGVVGEICLGGSGLAREYFNNPKLTAEKFVPDTYREGELIYRTGDLGRRRVNGDIEFLGRKDDQVKIRGFRVELAEIESILIENRDVQAAAVVVLSKGGEKQLACFVESNTAPAELKRRLAERLPGYMLPQHLVKVDRIPLTSNGKIDKKKLVLPENGTITNEESTELPVSHLEKRLNEIWIELLNVEKGILGIKDNFFEIGGHSLTAIRMVARVEEEFGVRIDLMNFFDDPNIQSLAAEIENILWITGRTSQSGIAKN